MKICYLTNSAVPSNYASTIQIMKMCESFEKLGNETVLIARGSEKKDIFKLYDIKSRFQIKILKNFEKFPLGFSYYFFSIISVIESLKYKPNIYITRNYFTCFLLTILKKKIIFEVHHDLKDESRIVRFLVKKFSFLNSNNIIKIIAITNGVKLFFINNYNVKENKFLVLPSGSSLKQNLILKKFQKNLNIGYFGSLFESRGLKIIYNLARIDKKNQYHVYGNLKNLKEKSKYGFIENLFLHGYIPYKEVSKNLSKMDILILPYASNITVAGNIGDITNFTSPLKLFDYLTAGKVIICSDFKILREVIKEKTNAIFIENYKNIFSWKKEIIKISNLSQKQLIVSKNNYKLSKQYSLTKRAKEILNVIYS